MAHGLRDEQLCRRRRRDSDEDTDEDGEDGDHTLMGSSADAAVDSKTGVRAADNKQRRYSTKSIPTGATTSRGTDEVSRGSDEGVLKEDVDSVGTYSSNEDSAAIPFQH